MATAQLWLLCVFAFQLVTDAVQQLHVTLLRVLLQSRNKRPRHGTSSLAPNLGILSTARVSKTSIVRGQIANLRCLRVLAPRPHDDISRCGSGLFSTLVRIAARSSLLEEAHGILCNAAHVTTGV